MAEPDNPAVTNILEPEDQTAEDSGVDEAIDDASSTQSISSSIFQYRVENGRTYATYGSGGTGIWAMDVADEHPEAEVLGVDLSPIQPSMVPPNCKFEIDDLEKEWTFTYRNLEPGGYIEVQDNVYPLASDDGTIHNTNILKWSELMLNAANEVGRSITVASKFKSMLEDAGFIDIIEIKKKIPMNQWPRDPLYKELGNWSCYMLRSGLDGISMGLLTKLGLTMDEVNVFLAEVRRDLIRTEIHGYWYTYLLYARKPGNVAD
ncbi:methyltransferase domain-containing protein [Fusarium mundagurra]|uniref:Methyltransferase domain-containing protein n=1 Tax=Fusarium mundagurra TaxID=1567541 RepID=A0A8H6D2V8_9HYPO|nr:methyltransferase domain-containing protein [Fusarium mundagurra]